MSEETREMPNEQQETAEIVNENQQQEAIPSVDETIEADGQSQVEHILQLAESNPAIKDTAEYQNLIKTLDKVKGSGETEGEQQQEEEDPQEEEPNEGDEEQQEEQENDTVDEDDTFGLTSKQKKSKLPKFDDDEAVVEYMKSKYSIKDPSKFFNSVDKWRNQSQEASKTQDAYQELLDGLGSLPQPIKDAIDAYAKAEDYREAFSGSTPSIDFSTEFDEVKKDVMVNHYFKSKVEKQKKKLEDGDIYEEDYNEYIDDLHDSAKRLFKSDKRDFERQRADIVAKEEAKVQSLKTSAVSSVDTLKEKYPNFSSNELKKIRTRLVNQDLSGLFYDKNGAFKEDAAEKLALALYGDKLISKLTSNAKREGGNEANADIVQRGKKKIVGSKSKQGTNKTEANNAIRHLGGQFTQDPYS